MSLIFLSGQIGFMKRHGFDCSAISSSGEALEAFAAREEIEVRAVEMRREITVFGDLAATLAICRALRGISPQIVHASTPKGGLLGMIAAWIVRVPVRIYHMRGLPLTTASGWRRLLLCWTERVACALANRVFCVSHSLRDVAVAERLCSSDKIRVLLNGSGNGVDAAGRFNPAELSGNARSETRARYGIPDSALVVGFVGRLVRDKGIVELISAWRVIREAYPSAHLFVVGVAESQDPLPEEIEDSLHDDRRIHLAGMNWDTPRLYGAMDLVVLPTYREGFPNVLLEAAAMELPVVATRVPGCVDAVQDGITGTLVPAGDAHELAEAICGYLGDSEARAKHGAAGRERVLRDFRPEAIWEAICQEYWQLLGQAECQVPVASGDISTRGIENHNASPLDATAAPRGSP